MFETIRILLGHHFVLEVEPTNDHNKNISLTCNYKFNALKNVYVNTEQKGVKTFHDTR